jgi:hypothetical protein
MTAIEDARAVAADLDRAVDACDIWAAWTHMAACRDALRDLISEHERLTAELALYEEHAGLTFPRPLKREEAERQAKAERDASALLAEIWGQAVNRSRPVPDILTEDPPLPTDTPDLE